MKNFLITCRVRGEDCFEWNMPARSHRAAQRKALAWLNRYVKDVEPEDVVWCNHYPEAPSRRLTSRA